MKVNANTLRRAQIVIDEKGNLFAVEKVQIIQPGKGGAFVQVEMRNIRTGSKTEQRYRTQETVERARLDQHEMTFLYAVDDDYTLMDKNTFEQVTIKGDIIGDPKAFLQDGMEVTVEMHEGVPLSVELPQTVILKIVEAEPVVKGQTASSSYKPAILENGARIMVPPHIETGTRVVVNIAEGTYLERAGKE